jgi:hypothetical protein
MEFIPLPSSGGVPILSSAPAAVAGTVVPWMLSTDIGTGNEQIRLVFPDDGTDHGFYIPLSKR